MAEIKYTTDGKKVVVVGKLNNQETIVQEVFIVGGNEVPSGENFVVKSLHDAPAVSWQKKEVEKMERTYEDARKTNDVELKKLMEIRNRAKKIYEGCASIVKNTNPVMFESISKMIGGEYRFVLLYRKWGRPEIIPIEDFVVRKDDYDFSLRLVSIFGKSDGDFSWNINSYRDGSGGWESFLPFETKEAAIIKALELIEQEDYTQRTIDFLNDNNLPINAEKLETFLAKEKRNIVLEIEKQTKAIEELNKKLATFK